MNKQKSMGLILVILLVFLVLISMITTQLLSAQMLSLKFNQHAFLREKNVSEATILLEKIVENITQKSHFSCLKSVGNPTKIRHKKLSWWQGNGCQFSDRHHNYYILEQVTEETCSEVEGIHEPKIANFYRLFLYFPTEIASDSAIILLANVVIPGEKMGSCSENKRQFFAGIQSVREW